MAKNENVFVSEEELSRQREYIEKIKELNRQYEAQSGQKKYALTHTFGCQQNENDTEQINGMLMQMGYEFTEDKALADFVLFNTCAVREHAELKVFGTVGALVHYKNKKPSMVIALCGCMMSQEHIQKDIRGKYRHVGLVFGTEALYRFPENLYKALTTNERVFDTKQGAGVLAENLPIRRESSFKAWVPIMSGCNNFCSYCIVPYVRGRERSRTREAILKEVKGLLDEGYKEITLLGQNVNSYHKDLGDDYDFSDLLTDINAFDGEFRIKFMTSHPKDASKKLFDTIAKCEKLSKHIHLPFQSGSDEVLKNMNRRYTSGDYLSLIEYARKAVPNITFTSDVIVGFPGETEDDFEKTLSLIKQVEFCGLYTFIYSKRNGTPAAEMENQVSKEVKKARFERLLQLQNHNSEEFHKPYLGKTLRVLIEGASDSDASLLTGHTDNNIIVQAEPGETVVTKGEFVNVEITKPLSWALYGKIVNKI